MFQLIEVAYAQDATPNSDLVGLSYFDYGIIIVGIAISVFALCLIGRSVAVSSGQAIVFGAGIALACLPFVASFEWTDKGIKYTRRTETTQLTEKVAILSTENTNIREDLVKMTESLRAANEKITALETAIARQSSDGTPALESNPEWEKFTNPGFFDSFLKEGEKALYESNRVQGEIRALQEQLSK